MRASFDGEPLKMIFISDMHYSLEPFLGQDGSKVFEGLLNVVEREKPELVIAAGDFGEDATSSELFRPILERTNLLTIYGNHDNLKLIRSLRNKNGDSCWLQDGIIHESNGTKIAGINGNIAQVKRKPHHKTAEEVNKLISHYSKVEPIDVLVTHEAPAHTQLTSRDQSLGHEVLARAIKELKPKLCLCGHIHIESQIIQINETKLINVDSSMRHGEYVTCAYESEQFKNLEIKRSPNLAQHGNLSSIMTA